MYAKNLEHILFLLCERSDVSHSSHDEYVERFKSLRGSALLPRGRERRAQELSNREIANAVFGLVSSRPGWAASSSRILSNLRPVGGIGASFFGCETLNDAVQLLLSHEDARSSFTRLTVTVAETGTNSNGGALLLHDQEGARRHVFFVSGSAVSLLAPGRQEGFDPEKHRCNAAAREMTFSQEFFRRLAQECETARLFPSAPEGDGSEYNSEEEQQQRFRKLGVRWGSRFLNIGVDDRVTWPSEETLINFDRYTLVLFPMTKENVQSVHMDLAANRLDLREAMTIVNRFLSVMAWCDDNFAIAQDGWSGNPVPVPVPRHEFGFRTTSHYLFDRKLPASQDAMRALALYREARNAQENKFVSYAVLNFYKIIEIRNHGKEHVRRWFRENFEALRQGHEETVDIKEFLALCGGEAPEKYIHNSCRIAVAHANKYSKSDPDDASEIDRLHKAARVMRLLARRFIKNEFGISDRLYSGN